MPFGQYPCEIVNGKCIYYNRCIDGVSHKCTLKKYIPKCKKTKALSDKKRGVRGIEDFTCPPECDISISQQLEGDLFYVETSDSQDGPVIDGSFAIQPGDTLRLWSAGGIEAMGVAGSALIQIEPNNILSSSGAPTDPPKDPTRPVLYIDDTTNELYPWNPSLGPSGAWAPPVSGGGGGISVDGATAGDFLVGTTGGEFTTIRPCEVEYYISQDTQTVEDLANIDNSYLVNSIYAPSETYGYQPSTASSTANSTNSGSWMRIQALELPGVNLMIESLNITINSNFTAIGGTGIIALYEDPIGNKDIFDITTGPPLFYQECITSAGTQTFPINLPVPVSRHVFVVFFLTKAVTPQPILLPAFVSFTGDSIDFAWTSPGAGFSPPPDINNLPASVGNLFPQPNLALASTITLAENQEHICHKTSLTNILNTSFKKEIIPICGATGSLDNSKFLMYESEPNQICQDSVNNVVTRYIDNLPTAYSSPFDPPIDGQSTTIISRVVPNGFSGYSISTSADTLTSISGSGTVIDTLGDDGFVSLTLPFKFPFFDLFVQDIQINANGFLVMDPENNPFPRATTWIPGAEKYVLAWAWRDISPQNGDVYYETQGTSPNRQFILEYNLVPNFGTALYNTMQLVLNEADGVWTTYFDRIDASGFTINVWGDNTGINFSSSAVVGQKNTYMPTGTAPVTSITDTQVHTFNDILRYYASSLPQGNGSPPGGVNVGDMWLDTSGNAANPALTIRLS